MNSSIVQLQIWDTPPNFDVDQLEIGLSSFSTLIYVIDMQVRFPAEYADSNSKMTCTETLFTNL